MNTSFISSYNIEKHPFISSERITKAGHHNVLPCCLLAFRNLLLSASGETKADYYNALRYFTLHQKNDAFVYARLDDFCRRLNIETLNSDEKDVVKSINRIVNTGFRPWRKKYKFWLLCDIAIILLEDQLIINAEKEMEYYISDGQQNHQLGILLNVLFDREVSIPAFRTANPLIEQYHRNRHFADSPERKYIVTANISAGKSTFINALIGKPLGRTSEEACTGNVNYFYNKPFEDGAIHFNSETLTLHAGEKTLTAFSWEKESQFASFFRLGDNVENRICIVDTPGVNSTINKKHGSIAKEALDRDVFDKVIYVLNASKLGTSEELKHVRWISEHIPHDKVIFVLNKLDNFKKGEDDIFASISGVRKDLLRFFENPIICPLSARFALLLKMKSYGDYLTPDEEDEYEYFAKKFKKSSYDLSKYYTCTYPDDNDESILLSQKCGIYGLEKLLQGGKV